MTSRPGQGDVAFRTSAATNWHVRQNPTAASPEGGRFGQDFSEFAEALRLARIGSWRWDIADDVVIWSEVLYEIFGLDSSEPPPSYARHAEIYTPDSFARLDAAVRTAVANGAAYSLDLEIRHSSGDTRWITGRGEAIRDASGSIIALRGTTQDITEKRHNSEALARSQRETQARLSEIEQIYRDTPVGLFTFDREFRFLRINERMAEINGLPVEVHIGKTMWEIIPQLAPLIAEVARPVLERGESVLDIEVHGRTEKAPTIDRDWLINYFPLRGDSGDIIGLFGAVVEITQRKQAEQALRDSERHFRLSIRNSPIGKAMVALDGRVVHVNQALSKMLGYTEDVLMTKTFQDITHPDDLAIDLDNVETLLSGKSDSYRMTKRYIHADGHLVDAQLDVTLLRGADGQPLQFISQIQDITERIALQEQQQILTQRLTLALRTSGIGVWDWHVVSNRIQWDDAMYRIYGLTPGSVVDYAVWRDAVVPEYLASAEEGLRTAIAQKSAAKREFRIRRPDGATRYIEADYSVVLDNAHNVTRVVGVNLDVTDRWLAEQRISESNLKLEQRICEVLHLQESLREQAIRDGLTGLYNRRHFDESLARELKCAEREGFGVSLIVCDLDHFKKLNDRHGHQAGDAMLKALSELMRKNMRESDILCRYGGEEFAVVLPRCSLQQAAELAERLRASLAALKLSVQGVRVSATLSQGLAYSGPGERTPQQLLRAADSALYRAKDQGRNQVVCAPAE